MRSILFALVIFFSSFSFASGQISFTLPNHRTAEGNAAFRDALSFYVKGEYDKALENYNKAVQLDPSGQNYYLRGDFWVNIGEYEKAIADYRQAVQLKPRLPYYHAVLAKLLVWCPDAGLRNGKEAFEHAKLACSLSSWKEYNSLESLAAAYADVGQFDKALKYQEKAFANAINANTKNRDRLKLCINLYKEHRPYLLERPKKQD